jgi:hypothetical protein
VTDGNETTAESAARRKDDGGQPTAQSGAPTAGEPTPEELLA